jgi:hypothetical protein
VAVDALFRDKGLDGLMELRGVGETIARAIRELLVHGRLTMLDRNTRILPEQEGALFEALPKLWRKRQRREMYRRLVAAIDLGLREGEMLKVQMKHIDFASWAVTLPPENAKGGATTDHPETVYATTPRVRQMLE